MTAQQTTFQPDEIQHMFLLVETTDAVCMLNLAGHPLRWQLLTALAERFRAGLERSVRWIDRMRTIFREAGLPEDLCYLPHVESSFTPNARSSPPPTISAKPPTRNVTSGRSPARSSGESRRRRSSSTP